MEANGDVKREEETEREQQIRHFKRNSNRILHERNIYVFLATVAEEAMDMDRFAHAELVGFLLVKKLMQILSFIKKNIENKNNIYKLEIWDLYTS